MGIEKEYLINIGELKKGKNNLITDVEGVRVGHVTLDNQDIKEIENMAEQLKNYKIDAAYTSPILRAKHTAQMILENNSILLNEDDRLKEVNFGLLEGLPCLFVDKLQLESSNWLDDLQMDYTGYEGENVEDVIQRHFELLNDIEKKFQDDDTILMVGHGCSLYAFIKTLLKNQNIVGNYGNSDLAKELIAYENN